MEIVGLSYACLKRLAELNNRGLYSHSGVKREEVKWSLADWAEKIEKNFEAHYFIQKGNPKEKRNGKQREVDYVLHIFPSIVRPPKGSEAFVSLLSLYPGLADPLWLSDFPLAFNLKLKPCKS